MSATAATAPVHRAAAVPRARTGNPPGRPGSARRPAVPPAPGRDREPPRPIRPLLAAVLLLGTVLGSLLAGAAPAAAHAALTGSSPADGAVVATAPKEVTLTFSEQVSMGKGSIRVLEPSGKRADTGAVRDLSAGGTVSFSVGMLPEVPNGTYTVAWQAVSADSHPISGAFTFSVGAPSETRAEVAVGKPGGGLTGFLYGTARYIAYTGFILMAGAAAFVLMSGARTRPARPLRLLIARSWVALTGATLAMLLLRTPYTGSGRLADAFDLGGLQQVLETKTGAALVSRLLLLGAAALFIAVLFGAYGQVRRAGESEAQAPDGEPGRDEGSRGRDACAAGGSGGRAASDREKDLTFGLMVGGGVLAAGIAATWALSEHASTGIQVWLAMPVDVLHLLAVACWLGGLAALLTTLFRAPAVDPVAVRRFSAAAFASVVVLAVTGLYQSWRQVGSLDALTGTPYGRLLLAKVALVAVLLVVARYSRRWTARLANPAPVPGARRDEHDENGHQDSDGTDEGSDDSAGDDDRDGTGDGGSVSAALSPGPEAPDPAAPAETASAAATAAPADAGPDAARAAQLARQRAVIAAVSARKARDSDPVRTGLRRSVLAETAVAAVLLAVTTLLTGTEPARTAAGSADARPAGAPAAPAGPVEVELPFDTGGPGGRGTARLTLEPGIPGPNVLHLWTEAAGGAPLDAPEVKVTFTLESEGIGPLPVTPGRLGPGHWSEPRAQIPMPGDWLIRVTVRTSDFDQTTVEKTMRIG
jgi:copper transport protein